MSTNRENVVWQAADGTWSRGFYAFEQTGPDAEWDVEYDFQSFWWASTGHQTEQAAIDAWHGSNPGGWSRATQDDNPAACERLDELVAKLRAEQRGRP